jgi:hypothetical protein
MEGLELLTEWELSKEKPTKRFKELLGEIAKEWFDKYTKGYNIPYEDSTRDFIVENILKHRHHYNPEKGSPIYAYFKVMGSSPAIKIVSKLIKGELKSS